MKMISSAKMHKFTARLQQLMPYRSMVQQVMGHLLATDVEFSSPLIAQREVHKAALVVFGSDDGLCGAFNANVLKFVLRQVRAMHEKLGQDVAITVIPVGRKIVKAVSHEKNPQFAIRTVDYMSTRSTAAQLHDFTDELLQAFLGGTYDRVDLVYMHYISAGRQVAQCDPMLPVSLEALTASADRSVANQPCIFEPGPNEIFGSILPLYIRSLMQEVFIESSASEQATRVMAMQTASDNAHELLEDLNLEYNKQRQANITTELLDIVGGQVKR